MRLATFFFLLRICLKSAQVRQLCLDRAWQDYDRFCTWRPGNVPRNDTSCKNNGPGARDFERRRAEKAWGCIGWVSAGPFLVANSIATDSIGCSGASLLLLLLLDRLAARRRPSPGSGTKQVVSDKPRMVWDLLDAGALGRAKEPLSRCVVCPPALVTGYTDGEFRRGSGDSKYFWSGTVQTRTTEGLQKCYQTELAGQGPEGRRAQGCAPTRSRHHVPRGARLAGTVVSPEVRVLLRGGAETGSACAIRLVACDCRAWPGPSTLIASLFLTQPARTAG